MIATLGAGLSWYLMGARGPGRLEIALAAFAVFFVSVMQLPRRDPWRRASWVVVGIALCAGEALVPTRRHDRIIEIVVGCLLLFGPTIGAVAIQPASRLFERFYVAIGGERDGHAEAVAVGAGTRPDRT
jgi:hypothetical protein